MWYDFTKHFTQNFWARKSYPGLVLEYIFNAVSKSVAVCCFFLRGLLIFDCVFEAWILTHLVQHCIHSWWNIAGDKSGHQSCRYEDFSKYVHSGIPKHFGFASRDEACRDLWSASLRWFESRGPNASSFAQQLWEAPSDDVTMATGKRCIR